MAGTYNENDHPRNPDGTYRDKDKETSNGELPADTGNDEQESEEKQRELAREEYDELSNLMDEEYSRLYDNGDQDYNYRQAVDAFDRYSKENPYEVGEFVNQRGDFISSDREAAAFIFAKLRMAGQEPKPSTITSDPFMPLDMRTEKCMEFQRARDNWDVNRMNQLDKDGAIDFMAKAGSVYGKDHDFTELTTPAGQESVEWAVNSFKKRHPDYLVDKDAVNTRIQETITGEDSDDTDASYPDAYYIMCAASGNMKNTTDLPNMYPADYENLLLTHELSKQTGMYLTSSRRVSANSGKDRPQPGDECWRTRDGYVSDKAFNRAFGRDHATQDRYLIYAIGTDQDREDLEDQWNDQIWLANKASECEKSNTSSILYRTIYPNFR